MGTLKAAVIGVGSMGQHHARVYTELKQTTLVGVADALPETAQRIGGKYGVPAYSDYRELLERERPDIVTVAAPTQEHSTVATAALEAGCHVLVEKPIAATLDEGESLIERAAALKRKLMVGHIVRFSPSIQALKQHLDAGELGRVFQIVCRRVGPFPARIRDVGVVVDLAPHDLDVMRFITGDEIVRVFAETEQQIHTAHEDLVLGMVRFRSGISGLLEINWLTPTKVREVVVLGERGMFRADDLTQDLYFYENAEVNGLEWGHLSLLKGVSEGRMVRYPIARYEPLKAELEAFATAVAEDKPVPVSGADGLAALRLALALVQSGQSQQLMQMNV
ncbi:MAG: Gfo/Idh/MocA family oxidoreductase [Anaerolineae bacterium]|jgi:predicted dehydrogenase|nr:Gfo/Idh/MocA family oxidoreductase [Anaerolineae bacterium]